MGNIRVQTLTAPSQRELERLVQVEIAKGWKCVGTPAEVTYNGVMHKPKWQQSLWRK